MMMDEVRKEIFCVKEVRAMTDDGWTQSTYTVSSIEGKK